MLFRSPKLAFFFSENQPYIGDISLLDINLHPDAIKDAKSNYTLLEKETVAHLLQNTDSFAHKGTKGHGLLVAGHLGVAGAAILAAKSAMRTGMGKITIHTPSTNVIPLQSTIPEAIIQIDKNSTHTTETINLSNYQAMAIGPGIGTHPDTIIATLQQIKNSKKPLVIDADALTIIGKAGALHTIPKGSILTPHPKEFETLVGSSTDSFSQLSKANRLATKQGIYIILKGHYTKICFPDGHIYINPTGNAGMATAGSGDVLTGILLSLLAQGYSTENATMLGVYLHGLAGDIAAQELTQEGVIASDLINSLPQAIKQLKNIKNENNKTYTMFI